MPILKFNKAELVNRSYSLKREILLANKTGAYCNTTIVSCNTRRYHGLLAVPVDALGDSKYLLLSSLDETLIAGGKQFNLGIHCYGDIYEPRGHKYVVDFNADAYPQITYKVGQIVLRKSLLLDREADRILIKFELLEAPQEVELQLKPFLAFRDIHALTDENTAARTAGRDVPGGKSFCLYEGFPDLYLQLSRKSVWHDAGFWYKGITYSDEARRGFACREDLFVPGYFATVLHAGDSLVFSASVESVDESSLSRYFEKLAASERTIGSFHDQLVRCADLLRQNRGGRKRITAGFSWLQTGLLRETIATLPGLTLYAGCPEEFEEILDNLIADEQERLYRRTTQVEAPLVLSTALQEYIEFGADPAKVWKKYGPVIRGILESYLPGRRKEVTMHPNGLLWAQMDGVALSWMNAYIDGRPVTERAGYQVETNAFWYNSICFALEMETRDTAFIAEFSRIRQLIEENFKPMFWDPKAGYLADYVGAEGRNMDIRPNQLYALSVKYSPVDDEILPSVLRVIDNELVTARGIRTLSPRDMKYKGVYEGTQVERDLAYHQGCTRPALLEQYVDVCFRVKGPAFWKKAQWLTEGFYDDLNRHGVGHFSELYDGDPPHEAHGAISSALSTASLLHVDYLLEKYKDK